MIQWRPRLRVVFVARAGGAARCSRPRTSLYVQHHFQFPPVFEWPTLFPLARPLAWLAVVFLGVDVVLERVGAGPPDR